jgi:hypothetical protein
MFRDLVYSILLPGGGAGVCLAFFFPLDGAGAVVAGAAACCSSQLPADANAKTIKILYLRFQ